MLPLFTYSLAVFNETLRMFPVVTAIPKISAEDTFLVATSATGERATIPIPKRASIFLDVTGLHYNPRHWKDPGTFNPSRFLETGPRKHSCHSISLLEHVLAEDAWYSSTERHVFPISKYAASPKQKRLLSLCS